MRRKSNKSEAFAFPVGVDPLRILLGLRDHWRIPAALIALGALLGFGVGMKLFNRSYTLEARVLRVDSSEKASEYNPRKLRNETLEGLAKEPSVLRRVREKAGRGIPLKALQSLFGIRYQNEGFQMFATSSESPERAKELLEAWITEFIEEGRKLQMEEAADVAKIMKDNVTAIQPQLDAVNQKILDFAKNQKIINDTTQVDEQLRRFNMIDRQMADARLKLQTINVRINSLLDPNRLALEHPSRVKLNKANERLRELRMDYEDAYSGVQSQIAVISRLEEALKRDLKQLNESLERFMPEAGDPHGVTQPLLEFLHQNISPEVANELRTLRDDRENILNSISVIKQELRTERQLLDSLPEKLAQIAELKQRQQELAISQAEANKKLTEATLITKSPPGYVKRFQEVGTDLMEVRRGYFKRAATTMFGAGCFALLGLLYAAFRELRRREMRTPLQAAIATRTMPRVCLLQNDEAADESQAREFWLTHLASPDNRGRRVLFPIIGDLKGEYHFWRSILENIRRDNAKALFIDVAHNPVSESFKKVMLDPIKVNREARHFNGRDADEPIPAGPGADPAPTPRKPSPDNDHDPEAVYVDESGIIHDDLSNKKRKNSRSIAPVESPSRRQITMSEPQSLIPNDDSKAPCAHYLQATDITVEELGDILQEVPQKYYVLCRWTIGPSSALSSLGHDFDQYYLINCPSTTDTELAASHSRIYRKVLDQPDGLIVIDHPTQSRILQSIQWLEKKFFQFRADPVPKQPRAETANDAVFH